MRPPRRWPRGGIGYGKRTSVGQTGWMRRQTLVLLVPHERRKRRRRSLLEPPWMHTPGAKSQHDAARAPKTRNPPVVCRRGPAIIGLFPRFVQRIRIRQDGREPRTPTADWRMSWLQGPTRIRCLAAPITSSVMAASAYVIPDILALAGGPLPRSGTLIRPSAWVSWALITSRPVGKVGRQVEVPAFRAG